MQTAVLTHICPLLPDKQAGAWAWLGKGRSDYRSTGRPISEPREPAGRAGGTQNSAPCLDRPRCSPDSPCSTALPAEAHTPRAGSSPVEPPSGQLGPAASREVGEWRRGHAGAPGLAAEWEWGTGMSWVLTKARSQSRGKGLLSLLHTHARPCGWPREGERSQDRHCKLFTQLPDACESGSIEIQTDEGVSLSHLQKPGLEARPVATQGAGKGSGGTPQPPGK